MKTRMTELMGTEYPIMQGGMQWVGRAELASAVSNAGALGTLTGLTQPTPEDLAKEIKRCQDMTDKPFAVNLTILPAITPPPYEEYAQAIAEGGVKIIETAGRNPKPFMPMFHEHGMKVIHKCTAVRHAVSAQNAGVDAVSIDGVECAGHPGEDNITNFLLLPLAAKALDIPFLASGGIGNGQGLAAALALGADGINMGTRFMATKEAPVHDNVKQAMVDASELDTAHIMKTVNNTMRVFKNSVAEKVLEIEAEPGETEFENLRPYVAGARGRVVFETGDMEHGVWTAGIVLGLIYDIPSCEELVQRIMQECNDTITSRLSGLLSQ